MEESKKWALERLEEANTIFEPWEMTRGQHLGLLVFWAVEMAILIYLAFHYFG